MRHTMVLYGAGGVVRYMVEYGVVWCDVVWFGMLWCGVEV